MSTGRWRLLAGGLGASLLLAAGATLLPSSAGADDAPPVSRSLVATASAEGMRMADLNGEHYWFSRFPNTIGWIYSELLDPERAVQYNSDGVEAGAEEDRVAGGGG